MASTTFTYTILTGAISTAGSIRNWTQHSSIPAEQILDEAQALIYTSLRVQEMIRTERVSIGAGLEYASLPDRFLDPIGFRLDEDKWELDYVQENLLGRERDADGAILTGRPERWTILTTDSDIGRMEFDVANDETEALLGDMIFYRTPELLGASVQTNFLTDRYPTLLRRACLALAFEHRKRWAEFRDEVSLANDAIAAANIAGDMRRRGQLMR